MKLPCCHRLKSRTFMGPLAVRRLRAMCVALAALGSVVAPVSSLAAQERPVSFDITMFEVAGNNLLPPGEVEAVVYPFMGPAKTPEDVEAARAALQAAFEQRGYATVSVYIPEQSVDSGVIRLDVTPQPIGQVTVAGGNRTSRDWVLSRVPSIQPGAVPNFTQVQRDIVGLNRSADRTVTPEIKAGEAPGTIDVALKVEDRSPLHGSIELNNFSSAQTSSLRLAASLRYDDVWGRGDSVSISTQLAPERTGDGAVVSANYLTRLGDVQLLVYGVHSESDIAIIGGINVIGSGDIVGGRLIVPLGQGDGFYHAATFGLDYKDFNEDLLLGADRDTAPIAYVPASLNWRGDWTGDAYRRSLSLTTTLGIRGLGDDIVAFGRKRFQAEPNFFHVRADGSVQQDIFGLQAYFHASGQWAGEPLISNEQFSVGGMDTVRGYFESEALVDYGIAIQSELRSPPLGGWIGGEPDDLRFHLFFDSGTGAIHEALPGQDVRTSLMSTGLGARVRLFKLFTGAVDVAAPIVDGPNKDAGAVTTRFRILGEF